VCASVVNVTSQFVSGTMWHSGINSAFFFAPMIPLTIYDMCKAMDRGMVIRDIHILEKDGGKSGHYIYQKEEK